MYITMYGQRRRCGYATNDSQAGVHRAPPEPSAQGTRPQVPRHGSRSDPSGHRPRSRADGNAGSRHRGVEADRALHRPATVATSAPRQAVVEAARGASAHRLDYWDAQLWATARLNQIQVILTEDFAHGRVLEGVHFMDPFAASFDLTALDRTH